MERTSSKVLDERGETRVNGTERERDRIETVEALYLNDTTKEQFDPAV